MHETWRLCPRHPAYLVSDRGRVRRIGRLPLKPYVNTRGYLYVDLGRSVRGQSVHGLVAETFLGPRPAGHDVDHLDWNRHNNAVSNLRYLRSLENAVRWKDRDSAGRNVWETPDDRVAPPEGHAPLTAAAWLDEPAA